MAKKIVFEVQPKTFVLPEDVSVKDIVGYQHQIYKDKYFSVCGGESDIHFVKSEPDSIESPRFTYCDSTHPLSIPNFDSFLLIIMCLILRKNCISGLLLIKYCILKGYIRN